MNKEIDFYITKLLENTSLNPIVGQTKTRKFLLTRLKILCIPSVILSIYIDRCILLVYIDSFID